MKLVTESIDIRFYIVELKHSWYYIDYIDYIDYDDYTDYIDHMDYVQDQVRCVGRHDNFSLCIGLV